MIERNQIFVNGKWVESAGTGVITVINPATEEPFATVPRGSAEDVDQLAQSAPSTSSGLRAGRDRADVAGAVQP